jgi:hypothetical protein
MTVFSKALREKNYIKTVCLMKKKVNPYYERNEKEKEAE